MVHAPDNRFFWRVLVKQRMQYQDEARIKERLGIDIFAPSRWRLQHKC
jgi:hypothetical protein